MKKIISLFISLFLVVCFNANSQTNGSFKSVRFYNVPDSAAFLATTWANFIAQYPNSGGMYYNEQSDKFRLYENGSWRNLGGSTTSGTVTSIAITGGSSGTDLNITGSPITTSGTITVNIPTAGTATRGLVTNTTQTFSGYKTFTATATFAGLNIGSIAGTTVAAPFNGDLFYTTGTHQYRLRKNGVYYDAIGALNGFASTLIPFFDGNSNLSGDPHLSFTTATNNLNVGDGSGTGGITVTNSSGNVTIQSNGQTSSGQYGITATGNVGLNPSTGIVTINSDPLQGGLYTPTTTNVANITSSTVSALHYMRINDEVTISGKVDLTYTSATTLTTLYISLPYSSNFTNVNDLQGTVLEYNESLQTVIEGNVANDVLELRFVSGAVGGVASTLRFTCMYTVK